jgi:hypothetical protein
LKTPGVPRKGIPNARALSNPVAVNKDMVDPN